MLRCDLKWYSTDMTLDALVIFAGGVVATLPFLGFPSTWDHAVYFFAGIFVIVLGIAVRRRLSQKIHTEKLQQDATVTETR